MDDSDFVWLDDTSSGGLHSADNTFFISANSRTEDGSAQSNVVRRSVQPKMSLTDDTLLQASASFVKQQQHESDQSGPISNSMKRAAVVDSGETGNQPRMSSGQGSATAAQAGRLHVESNTDKLAKKSWIFVTLYIIMMGGLHTAGYLLMVVESKYSSACSSCSLRNAILYSVQDLHLELGFMYATLLASFVSYFWLVSRSRGEMPNCQQIEGGSAKKSREVHTWAVQMLLFGPGPAECSTCTVIRPLRSKHSTGACIPTFDHYCVWTGGPVSATNHRAFVLFVAVQLLHLITIIPCLATIYMRREWGFWLAFNALFTFNGYLSAAVTFVVVFFTIFTGALLFEQLKNAAQGVTTNERIHAKRYPYVQEKLSRKISAGDALRRLRKWLCETRVAGADAGALRDIVAALPSGSHLAEVQDCPVATGLPDRASELWDNTDVRVSLKRMGIQTAGSWYATVREAVRAAL